MKHLYLIVASLAISMSSLALQAQETTVPRAAMPSSASPQYVIFHSPGPKWVAGVNANKQIGIEEHVNYFAQYARAGKIAMGGPFLDNTGGMMISTTGVREDEIEKIAANDPAVLSGLLVYTIRAWLPAVRSATQVVSVDRLPRGSVEDLENPENQENPPEKKEIPRSAGKNAANRGKSSF